MNLVKTATLCALMMTSSAFAEKAHTIDLSNDKCIAQGSGIEYCNSKAHVAWDKVLNKNYKALMQKSNKKQKKALKHAQRQWLKFRDNEMVLLSSINDTLLQSENALEMVKKRALKLQSHLQGIGEADPIDNQTTLKQQTVELYNMLGWMEHGCTDRTDETKHGKMLKAYLGFRENPQSPAYNKFVRKVEITETDTTTDGTGLDVISVHLKNATYRDQPLTTIVISSGYNHSFEQIIFDRTVKLQNIKANFVTSAPHPVEYNHTDNSIGCPGFYD